MIKIPQPPTHRCPTCRHMRSHQPNIPCLGCQQNPPMFRGGQGRSSKSIEGTGEFLVGLINAVILSIILFGLLLVCCT